MKLSYDDGTEIGGLVTRNDPVIITIDAEDPSGIPNVKGTYKYGEPENEIKFEKDQASGEWTGMLTTSDLSNNGSYELKFQIYNNVVYNPGEQPLMKEIIKTVNVQREGVVMDVLKPDPFQTHISGKTLDVEFGPVGDVKASTLEC